MTKAEKMFHELGFELVGERKFNYIFENNDGISIVFNDYGEGWKAYVGDSYEPGYFGASVAYAIFSMLSELTWGHEE